MAWLRGMGGWLGLQLGLSNIAVLGGANAGTSQPGGVAPASEIPWTPAMLGSNLSVWVTATAPSTILKTDGTAAASGDAVETWLDQTSNDNDLASKAASGGASTSATRPVYGSDGSRLNNIRPVTFNSGVATHRLNSPLTLSGSNSSIFILGRWRPPGSAVSRCAIGNTAGNFNTHLNISDSGVADRVTTGSTAGVIETDATTRVTLYEIRRVSTNNNFYGRKNDSETESAAGSGFAWSTKGVCLGNYYNGGSAGADFDCFEFIVFTGVMEEGNRARVQGWIAQTYGLAA
jgi:hypothetical protein